MSPADLHPGLRVRVANGGWAGGRTGRVESSSTSEFARGRGAAAKVERVTLVAVRLEDTAGLPEGLSRAFKYPGDLEVAE